MKPLHRTKSWKRRESQWAEVLQKKRLRIRNFELITKNLKAGLDSDSDKQATEYQKSIN